MEEYCQGPEDQYLRNNTCRCFTQIIVPKPVFLLAINFTATDKISHFYIHRLSNKQFLSVKNKFNFKIYNKLKPLS